MWRQYADADAERARLEGEVMKADRELQAMRVEADNARYRHLTDSDADAQAKIEALREHRAALIEARDAAVERSQELLRTRSNVEAREIADKLGHLHHTGTIKSTVGDDGVRVVELTCECGALLGPWREV